MGFMLEFPLHEQNFPPEATVSRRGVRVSWEPPQGGPRRGACLAGIQGCDLGNQRHLHQGLPSCCLEEVQTELPQLPPRETLSSGQELWNLQPRKQQLLPDSVKSCWGSGSLRAALDRLGLLPQGSPCWSHKRVRITSGLPPGRRHRLRHA